MGNSTPDPEDIEHYRRQAEQAETSKSDYHQYRGERYKRMYDKTRAERDRAVELLRAVYAYWEDSVAENRGKGPDPEPMAAAETFLASLDAEGE